MKHFMCLYIVQQILSYVQKIKFYKQIQKSILLCKMYVYMS